MKRQTPEHPKVDALIDRLDLPKYAVVGILELLWHVVSNSTPRGDIGSMSNRNIARKLEWDGDPDELIHALIETGWIDEHDDHRLIIHDWPDHADDAVHMRLGRMTKTFADGQYPNLRRMSKAEAQKCINAIREKTSDVCAQHAHAVHMPCALPEPAPAPQPEPAPEPTQPQTTPVPTPNGEGGADRNGHGVGGIGDAEQRMLDAFVARNGVGPSAISRQLSQAGVESLTVRGQINQRLDLSPELIDAVIKTTQADPAAQDPAKLIAHRLTQWTSERLHKLVAGAGVFLPTPRPGRLRRDDA